MAFADRGEGIWHQLCEIASAVAELAASLVVAAVLVVLLIGVIG